MTLLLNTACASHVFAPKFSDAKGRTSEENLVSQNKCLKDSREPSVKDERKAYINCMKNLEYDFHGMAWQEINE